MKINRTLSKNGNHYLCVSLKKIEIETSYSSRENTHHFPSRVKCSVSSNTDFSR